MTSPVPLSRSDIDSVIAAAVAAPSVLNTQPWRFEVEPDQIDLFLDDARALPATDPESRAALMSCGAALLNLRLAVKHLEREAQVAVLPNRDDDRHVARIQIRGNAEPSLEDLRLYREIPHRRTSRYPFQERSVPAAITASLKRSAADEDCLLHLLDDWSRADVVHLLSEADLIQRADDSATAEISRWVNVTPDAGSGIPTSALGPRPRDSRAAVRDFGSSTVATERPRANFEAVPTLAVLHTPGDEVRDWICAGQGMERVLLSLSAFGLSASLSSQAVEVPGLQWLMRDPAIGGWVPHVVIRMGYGPRGSATPRRPLSEVVTIR